MRRKFAAGKAALAILFVGCTLCPNELVRTLRPCFSGCIDAQPHLGSLSACRRYRRQLPWLSMTRRAAPWDFLQGSMVDPNYWKQQYFLAGKIKTLLPDKRRLCALELAPGDSKYIGYMVPDKDEGSRLDNYVVLGSVDGDLKENLKKQAEVFRTGIELRSWEPGRKAQGRPESVDVALLAPGAASRLGSASLGAGLQEVRRLLRFDGRVLIVAGEEDEAAMGGRFESVLEAQDLADLQELDAIGLDGGEGPAGQLLRGAGLRLIRVVRDDCGLTIGMCVKREDDKTPRAPRAQRRKVQSDTAKRRSQPPSSRGGRAARRALAAPKLVPHPAALVVARPLRVTARAGPRTLL